MTDSITKGSGKNHTDENFPVASVLIAPRHRPVVLAFYKVARMADDVADHPGLSSDEKLRQLALIEASLRGTGDTVAEAVSLARILAERRLSNVHMLDLLEAFRRDAVKSRYADWGELMDYCRFSAAPVGRFMLEVHGETRSAWDASDALCAALQVINHLQDCGRDYQEIDRVYLPLDALAAAGLEASDLGRPVATAALLGVIRALAQQTRALLDTARPLSGATRDGRLALEIGVIQALAESLADRLLIGDPLSQRISLRPLATFGAAFSGAHMALIGRLTGRQNRRAEA